MFNASPTSLSGKRAWFGQGRMDLLAVTDEPVASWPHGPSCGLPMLRDPSLPDVQDNGTGDAVVGKGEV